MDPHGELSGRPLPIPLESFAAAAASGCRPGSSSSSRAPRADYLRRVIRGLLNKACPENAGSILEQLADVRLDTGDELAFAVGELFERALLDKHYGETYADLAFGLKSEWPSFPPTVAGGPPVSLSALLIDICCAEFEMLPRTLEVAEGDKLDAEEVEAFMRRKRDRMLAFMRLVGYLFQRGLLGLSFLSVALRRLVLEPGGTATTRGEQPSKLPGEHEAECACELLRSVGASLQATPGGERELALSCGRLLKLRKARTPGSKALLYSKRVQFAIQDVIELRDSGWERKAARNPARTREELREDARREEDGRQPRRGASSPGADGDSWRRGPSASPSSRPSTPNSRRCAAAAPPLCDLDALWRRGSDGDGRRIGHALPAGGVATAGAAEPLGKRDDGTFRNAKGKTASEAPVPWPAPVPRPRERSAPGAARRRPAPAAAPVEGKARLEAPAPRPASVPRQWPAPKASSRRPNQSQLPRPQGPYRRRGTGAGVAEAATGEATAEVGGSWLVSPALTPEEVEEEDFLGRWAALAAAAPRCRQAGAGCEAAAAGNRACAEDRAAGGKAVDCSAAEASAEAVEEATKVAVCLPAAEAADELEELEELEDLEEAEDTGELQKPDEPDESGEAQEPEEPEESEGAKEAEEAEEAAEAEAAEAEKAEEKAEAEVPVVSKVPQAPKPPEEPDLELHVTEAPAALETGQAPEALKAPEVPEMPATPEVQRATDEPGVSVMPEAADAAEAAGAPAEARVLEGLEEPKALEAAGEAAAKERAPAAKELREARRSRRPAELDLALAAEPPDEAAAELGTAVLTPRVMETWPEEASPAATAAAAKVPQAAGQLSAVTKRRNRWSH